MQNILENMDSCVGCSSCAQRCVSGCITMVPDGEGFLIPRIDTIRCTDCGLCRKVCPVFQAEKAITGSLDQCTGYPKAWAAWSLDDAIRLNSSSGGLFSMLAESCIRQGGTVFGAAFDKDFMVRHIGISKLYDLDSLRRSKYVQSDINQSYRQAEKLLTEHRPVLFSGTGCQIAGLKSFLGREYPELITVDVACYGVPSPKIWFLYLEHMKKRFKSDIRSISFRDKTNGWKNYCMHIRFVNGRSHRDAAVRDTFFIGFGKNLFSRKSCYHCRFRHPHSRADLTLADFWAVEKLAGISAHDNKGVSLVIANTSRGQKALDAIKEKCFFQESSFTKAASGNPRLTTSASMPSARALFFADLEKGMGFSSLKRRYMNRLVQSIKLTVKSVLGSGLVDKLNKLRGAS